MDSSIQPSSSRSATLELLTYYSLETDHYPAANTKAQVLDHWLRIYPESWVRLALIESLYQGRYKTFSVEQLLALWNRRGQPVYHFNHEFESLVCHNIPHQMEQAVVLPTFSDGVRQNRQNRSNRRQKSIDAASSDLNMKPKETKAGAVSSASQEQKIEASVVAQPDEDPWGDQPSILASVLAKNQLLPLKLGRLGQQPIHQFMPEAEPIEFCEKLEAIARSQH